ncbi:hypothetical protein EVAR_19136_1 [Eumeta japonica]|uniref:Uncharacterized protein n=1 Tax=Eumeta variegata TaxID=151549 RepID=A0A4C1VPC3_EUMVA|nr:hypothetical protein EVAR_19136_1 [Eumeta japonica]
MLQEMSNMPNSDIMDDIRRNLSELKQPTNLDEYIDDDAKKLQCKSDAPMEVKLWFLIRKMHLLCNKSTITEARNKGNIETFQKSLDEVKSKCRDLERSTDTYKYIIKCLQEKQSTLEEQVEILTAVESK